MPEAQQVGGVTYAIRVAAEGAEAAISAVRRGFEEVDAAARKMAAGVAAGSRESAQALIRRREENRSLLELARAVKAAGQSIQQADPRLRAFAAGSGAMRQGIDGVIAALERESAAMNAETGVMIGDLERLLGYWYDVRAGVERGASAELTADGSQLMAEADSAIATLLELLGMLRQGEGGEETEQRRGGGGGGKSRKEREAEEAARAAEEAQRAQEEAWQKQLDAQLRMLDRKKRLNEISTTEEIAQLERIMRKYAKTAEQRLAMEERIFEARARLRDEEISQIDRLNDGIITALRNRYEEQRRLEEDRLDASAKSWQEWADENVKAIQAQIDALDELTKTEDREAQDAAKRRKIAATEAMLAYTTDEYNREQLQKELARLQEEYDKWLRQNAIADEKDRLRAEQDAIRERAEAEQDALAEQREALRKYYEELLKEASLRAEAERMLIGANQEEILDLIESYAPDYEATGRTLGERLHEGLTAAMGNITDWIEDFAARIQGIQAEIAATALRIADAHAASGGSGAAAGAPVTEVTQTVYFNVPVESPADTKRKLIEASEELARMVG